MDSAKGVIIGITTAIGKQNQRMVLFHATTMTQRMIKSIFSIPVQQYFKRNYYWTSLIILYSVQQHLSPEHKCTLQTINKRIEPVYGTLTNLKLVRQENGLHQQNDLRILGLCGVLF